MTVGKGGGLLTALALATLTATGCDTVDNTAPPEPAQGSPAALATRDDVIRAVATAWEFIALSVQAETPQRPSEPSGQASGIFTRQCPDGGTVSFDEDRKRTTFDSCGSRDDQARAVLTAVMQESCEQPLDAADHCLSVPTIRAMTESHAATRVVSGRYHHRVTLQDYGYQSRFDAELDLEGSGDIIGRLQHQTRDFHFATHIAGSADGADGANDILAIELSGAVEFSSDTDTDCTSGRLGIGTGEQLFVLDTFEAALDGELILSGLDSTELVVDFNGSGIEFEIDNQQHSASEQELAGFCLGRYGARAPSQEGDETAPDPGTICIPPSVPVLGGMCTPI